jgi:hypothetical protein
MVSPAPREILAIAFEEATRFATPTFFAPQRRAANEVSSRVGGERVS